MLFNMMNNKKILNTDHMKYGIVVLYLVPNIFDNDNDLLQYNILNNLWQITI